MDNTGKRKWEFEKRRRKKNMEEGSERTTEIGNNKEWEKGRTVENRLSQE